MGAPQWPVTPPWPADDDDGFDLLPQNWLGRRAAGKWSLADDGVIPAWVADMDFPVPAVAREALSSLAAGGDWGYTDHKEADLVEQAWAERMKVRYAWTPRQGRLRLFTDVVQAVEAVLDVATEPGDGVLLLTPSYPLFVSELAQMGRPVVPVPVYAGAERWELDLACARAAAVEQQAKALLLVNPHNPTGRVLDGEELAAVAALAADLDLLVISDEVHADLVLAAGVAHVPFASLNADAAGRTVTLYSASKSFNMGAMCCATAHFGPARPIDRLSSRPRHLTGRVSLAAVVTTLACWGPEGDEWLKRCLSRLQANRAALGRWLDAEGAAVGVKAFLPEATYLAWLDFTQTYLGPRPASWLLEKAKVWLSEGEPFGPGGTGFCRLNFATTPSLLDEVLGRVTAALASGPGADA